MLARPDFDVTLFLDDQRVPLAGPFPTLAVLPDVGPTYARTLFVPQPQR